MRAINEASTGVEALVPPPGLRWLWKIKSYIGGPARAARSGTTRPLKPSLFGDATEICFCQPGLGKIELTPPPVAPPTSRMRRPFPTRHVCSTALPDL